jgi:hypothetical protein
LHLEALRYLWHEVQALQAWKAHTTAAAHTVTQGQGEQDAAGSVDEGIARLLGSLQANSRWVSRYLWNVVAGLRGSDSLVYFVM